MSPWWWLLWVACRPSGEVGPSTPSAGDTVVSSSPGATADSGPVRDTGPWAEPWVCGDSVVDNRDVQVSVAVTTSGYAVGIYVGIGHAEMPDVRERVPLTESGFETCWYETYLSGGPTTLLDGGRMEVDVGEQGFAFDFSEGTSLSSPRYPYFVQHTDHPDFDWADWLDQPVTFRLEGSGEVPPIETMWVGRTALAAVEVDSPELGALVDPHSLVFRWAPGASPTGRVTLRWLRDTSTTYVVCDVVDTGAWSPPPSEVAQLEPSQSMSLTVQTAPACARPVAPGVQLTAVVAHRASGGGYVDPESVP